MFATVLTVMTSLVWCCHYAKLNSRLHFSSIRRKQLSRPKPRLSTIFVLQRLRSGQPKIFKLAIKAPPTAREMLFPKSYYLYICPIQIRSVSGIISSNVILQCVKCLLRHNLLFRETRPSSLVEVETDDSRK